MKNAVRFATAVLMTPAAIASAHAPKTPSNPIKGQTIVAEGSAPVPLCRPGTDCK